jgi:hypothetical protein
MIKNAKKNMNKKNDGNKINKNSILNITDVFMLSIFIVFYLLSGLLIFFKFIDILSITNCFSLMLVMISLIIIFSTCVKYRYYLSKYLYFNGDFSAKDISKKYGRFFFRDSVNVKNDRFQNENEIPNKKSYK